MRTPHTPHMMLSAILSPRRVLCLTLSVAAICLAGGPLFAQKRNLDELFAPLGGELGLSKPAAKASVTARLTTVSGAAVDAVSAGEEVRLSIRIDMPAGAYTYSQNRTFGGATKISVTEVNGLQPLGEGFTADRKPTVKFEPAFGLEVEKFSDNVTWTRRFRVTGAVPADRIAIAGEINFQVCNDDLCMPLSEPFQASLEAGEPGAQVEPVADRAGDTSAADAGASSLTHGYVMRPVRQGNKPDPLTLQFELQPPHAQVGETVTLAITMTLEDDWHTFGLEPHPRQVSKPTEIELRATPNLRPLGAGFTPSLPPETTDQGFDNITEYTHHGTITWRRQFEVVAAGEYGVAGTISYQICKTSCLRLNPVDFSLGSVQQPGDLAAASSITQSFALPPSRPITGSDSPTASSASAGSAAGGNVLDFDLQTSTEEASLPWYLLMAFLGGLILNVMPCVLPVLAIKVMSFVQQAGESRGRVLLLNVSYSLGVISVFLILAALAVTLKLGWGGLFQKPEFILVMTGVVFAMGLSLLGVFEIPIPGMVGVAGGQHREGLPGAFSTGIFATLLATPCTGPFMGSTLAWSVKEPPLVVFLVWGVMGLGMASPYLMVGLFPRMIRFLPKPGMWMVRFKEFAGFTLLAAAIWLMSTMPEPTVIPTLIILLGIALGVWMLGTLYTHSSPVQRKVTVRIAALAVMFLFGWYGYGAYQQARTLAGAVDPNRNGTAAHAEGELPWQPFSEDRLEELLLSGTPILIDFTADWCLICKTNERVVLNTKPVADFVDQHGIVPLIADLTVENAELTKWLEKFGGGGVPLYVIVPPGKPDQSIILNGQLTQSRILDALQKAVSTDVAVSQTIGTTQ